MMAPAFSVKEVVPEPYGVVPTLIFRLRVGETSGPPIPHIALRCQIRIEPERRKYSPDEEASLLELFGERSRWGETLKPLFWSEVSVNVRRDSADEEIALPVPCTYDFDVAAARYLHALRDGEIPIRLLFSGTAFAQHEGRMLMQQIPWDREAVFRLPVRTWRELMDRYYPNAGWLRLRRETLDALQQFKGHQALPTWDDTVAALLRRATAGR
jgi:hypothetical protein